MHHLNMVQRMRLSMTAMKLERVADEAAETNEVDEVVDDNGQSEWSIRRRWTKL